MLSLPSISSLVGPLLLLSASCHAQSSSAATTHQVQTVHKFPNGVWVENLAVRSSGGILLDIFTTPETLYINPNGDTSDVRTLATYPAPANAAVGVVELGTDIFYVATTSFSFTNETYVSIGSGRVWKLDLTKYTGANENAITKTQVGTFPKSGLLNGMTAIPGSNILLVADAALGLIWRLNLKTSAVDVAINNTFTQPSSAGGFAVNGVHYNGGYVYLTNTAKATYARIPVDTTGTATGAGQTLQTGVAGDDFVLTASPPAAYIAAGFTNEIVSTAGTGGTAQDFADILGPTALAFGRTSTDKNTLYITSTGNDSAYAQNPVPVGGALSKIVLS